MHALPGILDMSCSVRKRTRAYSLFTYLSLGSAKHILEIAVAMWPSNKTIT